MGGSLCAFPRPTIAIHGPFSLLAPEQEVLFMSLIKFLVGLARSLVRVLLPGSRYTNKMTYSPIHRNPRRPAQLGAFTTTAQT